MIPVSARHRSASHRSGRPGRFLAAILAAVLAIAGLAALPMTANAADTTHVVTFDANGGVGTMSPQSASSSTALDADTYTKSGYIFEGWSLAPEGQAVTYADQATYSFTTDVTLYAVFWPSPLPLKFMMSFTSNGDSGAVSDLLIKPGSPGMLPANGYTRPGSTFTGWVSPSGNVYQPGVLFYPNDHIVFTAQWQLDPIGPALHTVTFDPNGGSGTMSPQTAVSPTALTANTFTKSGSSFAGWSLTQVGNQISYADQAVYSFASDVTLYAVWSPSSQPQNFVLTFGPNGGSGTVPDVSVTPGDSVTMPANGYTRAGFTFSGWVTPGGVVYQPGDTITPTGDLALQAQWTPFVPTAHTVLFDPNGAGLIPVTQIAAAPTALTANTFTRPGYTFDGWNTAADGSGTAYTDGEQYSFSADLTLYAQWTANFHTVTFEPNGGLFGVPFQVAVGPTALEPNSSIRPGYTFTGWNTNPDGSGTAYADGAIYTFAGDITLYAQWAPVAPPTMPLTSGMVTVTGGSSFTYTGSPIKPDVTVGLGSTTLVEGTDYTVSYGTNTTVAQGGTVSVTGEGAYSGTVTVPFTITPKPITVTADDQTKVVGTPDPALTWTAPGLVPGDTLTGSLTYFGSAVGSYDIVQLTPFANPNYDITFVRGTMTITREAAVNAVISLVSGLPLTIATTSDADQVADATKAYDALSDEQKAQVPQTILDDLQQAQQQAGDVNHTTAGATASGSALPWNVRLTVTSIPTTDARYTTFVDTQTGRDVLALYDVSFTDTLTGQAWEPPAGHTVTIALAKVSVAGHTGIAVVHQNADGTVETVTSTVSGSTVTFDGSSFSPYGVTADVQTSTAGQTPGSTSATKPASGSPASSSTSSSTTGSGLADTGTDVSAAIAIAVLALLTGAGLLLGIRRRKRA